MLATVINAKCISNKLALLRRGVDLRAYGIGNKSLRAAGMTGRSPGAENDSAGKLSLLAEKDQRKTSV